MHTSDNTLKDKFRQRGQLPGEKMLILLLPCQVFQIRMIQFLIYLREKVWKDSRKDNEPLQSVHVDYRLHMLLLNHEVLTSFDFYFQILVCYEPSLFIFHAFFHFSYSRTLLFMFFLVFSISQFALLLSLSKLFSFSFPSLTCYCLDLIVYQPPESTYISTLPETSTFVPTPSLATAQ